MLHKNKFILTVTFLANLFLYGAATSGAFSAPIGSPATNSQPYFKIYKDDASLNAATPYADQNTNYSVPDNNNFRIRFAVCRSSGDGGDFTTARRLQFKKDSGSYATITTDCNNDVCLSDSANFADSDVTTQRLAYASTFIAGQGKDTDSDTSLAILQQLRCLEDEYSLKFQPAAVGHTYEFNIFLVAGSQPNFPANPIITPVSSDTTAPTISSISSTPSSDSATIVWTTNEDSSSQVEYGLVSSYGSSTSETDTSTRVSSHSVTLGSLQACARYYFRVKSKDAVGNQGISDQSSFSTSGCEVSSLSTGSSTEMETSGGSVSLSTDEGTATLTVPGDYFTESASIQLNKLEIAYVPTAPENQNLVSDNFFDLLAVSDSGSVISSFSQPVTFTIFYGSETESAYDEKTLDVYKYSGGLWDNKNCLLDTSANTLTCALNSFSVYGVFGDPISDDEEYSPLIAVGDKKTINLSKNETVSLKSNKFVFRGKIPSLEKGDIVQILKNGELLANKKINSRKGWRYRMKQTKNTTSTYQFRYLDKETKERVQLSPEYNILIDRIKPRFGSFQKSTTASAGDYVSWTATDNDQIKYYQVKFRGKETNSAEARFQIPSNSRKGISRLKVKAFDRAENFVTKRMWVRVR